MKIINRTVLVLSLVSMFADIASEMLYPVVPVYLKEIGFSVFLIGLLEGVAEFTAGLSKGYFGKRSDERGLRLPFIKGGYFLSAVSKPMMAVFSVPIWIFLARTIDRLGKGLRTAARDALLSDNATPETKARVFGFHRSLDTLGAFIGPVIALCFLYFFPQQYKWLFYWALLPGLVSVVLIYLLREVPKPVSTLKRGNFFSFFSYWKIAGPEYKKLVSGLLLFALFNSSDVFLLLKTKEVTGSDTTTIIAYIFYNLVYAIAAYPMGILADQLGMKKIFVSGLLVFAVVYFLFGYGQSTPLLFVAFFLYALYAAATEGIGKAWITNLSHRNNTATAIGFYTSCQSICSLLASAMAGLLWSIFGSTAVFLTTSIVTICAVIYFLLVAPAFQLKGTGTKR
jgi:MFS family permease